MPGNKPSYKIFYSSDVIKYDLPKLDNRVQSIIKRKIEKLRDEPYMGLPLRGPLVKLYKIKVSRYRIVYEIEINELVIKIIAIEKRGDSLVYEIVESRIKR